MAGSIVFLFARVVKAHGCVLWCFVSKVESYRYRKGYEDFKIPTLNLAAMELGLLCAS